MKIPPFKLERFFAKYEFKAKYLLCSSDCESLSVGDLLAFEPDATDRFQSHWLGYTESLGSPELRHEISALYTHAHVTAHDILVFTGAEEAIFVCLNAALEAGDHVIVHAPGYQSLYEVARAIGAEVSLWMANEAENWELDVDWLEANIRPNTRAIIINCPHNPTGYLMSTEKLGRIIEIARRNKILLFSDEVYRGLEHDPANRLPPACDLYENAVSLGVLSKTYGLAGLRIGWLATQNYTLYRKMAALKDYTTICNSAPSEFLACIALRNRDAIANRNRRIILKNLATLDDFFARHTDLFDWHRPKGGSTAFPRIKVESSEAFCKALVEKTGILLLPSPLFDYDDQHVRVGFGRKNLPEAVEQFETELNERVKA